MWSWIVSDGIFGSLKKKTSEQASPCTGNGSTATVMNWNCSDVGREREKRHHRWADRIGIKIKWPKTHIASHWNGQNDRWNNMNNFFAYFCFVYTSMATMHEMLHGFSWLCAFQRIVKWRQNQARYQQHQRWMVEKAWAQRIPGTFFSTCFIHSAFSCSLHVCYRCPSLFFTINRKKIAFLMHDAGKCTLLLHTVKRAELSSISLSSHQFIR